MTDPTDDHIRLAEALIFASTDPVPARQLAALLPEDVEAEDVLRATQARYANHGVELAEIGGGWQFRTAADLAPRLTRVISRPRRLPRVAMETLAIIAWNQPVTRAQIEETRGATLSQQTLDALLEAGLVRTAGHREVPGRPILWATTPQFLAQFGLRDLRDLPKREELVNEQPSVLDPPPPAAAPEEAAEERPGALSQDPVVLKSTPSADGT
jgi:segregation and condensation protein B